MVVSITKALKDVDLSSEVVVSIRGDDSGSTLELDNYLSKTSENPVKSSGIWKKLETLSSEISAAAHTLDLELEYNIDNHVYNPVPGYVINAFGKDLSTAILNRIDENVTSGSTNPVKSAGIYTALSTLSSQTLNEAYSHDLTLQTSITNTGTKPVDSKTIYEFAETLSTDIIQSIPESDIDDEITEGGEHPVKSGAIYNALTTLEDKIPTDYVKIGQDDYNSISSSNDFVGNTVMFDMPDNNGPLVCFNTDEHYHFEANGVPMVIPNDDLPYGPGRNIDDTQTIKTWIPADGGIQLSSDIMATRRWTKKMYQQKLSDQQMSTINSLIEERKTIITFEDGHEEKYSWEGTLTQDDLESANLLFKTESSIQWKRITSIKFGSTITELGEDAIRPENGLFFGCNYLKSIIIPNSVTKIGNFAFCYCTELTDVDISKSVKIIGWEAFDHCLRLKYLKIPNNVKFIGNSAFSDCNTLTSLLFEDRTLDEVKAIVSQTGGNHYPWGLEESVISTKKIVGYDVQISSENGIVLDNCDLSVNNGNYIQTSNANFVNNYSAKNAFVQAEEAVGGNGESYGPASIGSMGYCIIGVVVDGEENGFKLSGDISKLRALVNNDRVGAGITYSFDKSRTLHGRVLNSVGDISSAHFSFSLDDKSASIKYTIKSIDNDDVVWFNEPFESIVRGYSNKDEDWFKDKWLNDDNALYVAGLPEIGNMIIKNFYAQHLEGGSNRIPAKYGHTEGRDNIADVRYTHAEGSHTIAGEMASHAEGFLTTAGGRYSHAEGFTTTANGLASHSEGSETRAEGSDSHAGGTRSKAYGPHSFAFGNNPYTSVSAYSGIALGGEVSAIATNTFACGRYAYAKDDRSFVWNSKNGSIENSYESNGAGTFNINPDTGISGFYIGDKSLYSYLSDFAVDSGDDQPIEQIITNISNTFVTHQLDEGFIYNDGKSFEESPSAAVFITAGNGQWNFLNRTGTNRFEGKFIKVNPGDIITYQKPPYPLSPVVNPGTTSEVSNGGQNKFYTTYIRGLTSHDVSEFINNITELQNAPIDKTIGNSTDDAVLSSWNGKNSSHQFYRQNQLYSLSTDNKWYWSADYVNSTDPASWKYMRDQTKAILGNNFEYLYESFEVSVKIPENTYMLYVCTKYYNTDQTPISFKINGYELIEKARTIEKSHTENSFNFKSLNNIKNTSLTCFNTFGYSMKKNGNYGLTHFIPCKYGDQILVSIKSPYVGSTPNIYTRSVEYFDANFNRLSASCASGQNNGFQANYPLNYNGRKCVHLVAPIAVKGCAYVRIGIPMGTNSATFDDAIIQVIPLNEYPKYMLKEPNSYIPFQKVWTQKDNYDKNRITDFEGKTLLFFGDSITRNSLTSTSERPYTSTTDSDGTQYEATTKGYVQYLSEELHSNYINAGNGADTAAKGNTTKRASLADKLTRWENEPTYSNISADLDNAAAVFVMIGVNDWTYSWTEFGNIDDDENIDIENFCGAIRFIRNKLIDKFQEKAPIIFMTPLKRVQQTTQIDYTENNALNKKLIDYCNAIKTLCANYDGVYVIDTYNVCKIDPGTKTNYKDRNYLPDGTHPSSLGHKVISKCILKRLPEILNDFYSLTDPIASKIS